MLAGILIFIVGVPISWMGLVGFGPAFDDFGNPTMVGIALILLVLVLWAAVFFRHRWPLVPYLVGMVLSIAWGDSLLMLVGMFHLIIRAPRRTAEVSTAIGSGILVAGVIRLCFQSPALNPFSIMFVGESNMTPGSTATQPTADSVLGMNVLTIIAGVVGLAISIGFGYLIRRTRRMKAVETFAVRETRRNEDLSAELARTSERELLARELHDTLSHRLSVISLHSGALEVGAESSAEVSATAHALREEVHASLEDLRHLVGGVREGTLGIPQQTQPAPPDSASLNSLPQLIASVQATGTIVRPSIIISDAAAAPTILHRAVYRVVQESLTNAMKHAPGTPVDLSVSVSAAQGARIVVANQAPPDRRHPLGPDQSLAEAVSGLSSPLASSGSGAGLEGIRERANVLGGRALIGLRDGSFVVEVIFPPFMS